MMMNQDSQHRYVPAVVRFHMANARGEKAVALEAAKDARDSAPCESEVARWTVTIQQLEYRMATPIQRLRMFFAGAGF